MQRVVSATEAKLHFGDLLRRVSDDDDVVLVERGGSPQVVVLSVPEYERLVAGQVAGNWRERAQSARERIRAEIGVREIPKPEDVIRDLREERSERFDGLR